jgi:hypothetical protein
MIMGFRIQMSAVAAFAIGAIAWMVPYEAFAVPITYTEQAIATGSLDGIAFTNASVVETMFNDTTNVIQDTNALPFGYFYNYGTVTVSVSGGTAVTFTDSMIRVFIDDQNTNGGFADSNNFKDLLTTFDSAFVGYSLASAFGPVTDTAMIDAGVVFNTTGGAFTISSISGGLDTFTATVPEPSTLALLGGALLCFGWFHRRHLFGVGPMVSL